MINSDNQHIIGKYNEIKGRKMQFHASFRDYLYDLLTSTVQNMLTAAEKKGLAATVTLMINDTEWTLKH